MYLINNTSINSNIKIIIMQRMNFRALDFTLRVWLTSVLVAPAIYIIVQWYVDSINNVANREYLNPFMYLMVVIFELIFSFVIWLIFWGIVEAVVFYCHTKELQRWLIFISAMILTIVPLALLGDFESVIDYKNWMFTPMVANALCIGCGCWLYKLE
jgi:uncharacterized membrane protein HdeD (DUF308 family)